MASGPLRRVDVCDGLAHLRESTPIPLLPYAHADALAIALPPPAEVSDGVGREDGTESEALLSASAAAPSDAEAVVAPQGVGVETHLLPRSSSSPLQTPEPDALPAAREPSSSDQPQPDPPTLASPAPLRYTVILALCFLVLFTGFFTAQNLLTSVVGGNLAYASLAVLYYAFAVGNLFAAQLVRRFSPRACLAAASATYTTWHVTAALAAFDLARGLLYAGAVLIGLGAAVLWVSQSVYLAKLTTSERIGRINGLFFVIFGFSPIIGQGIALLLTGPLGLSDRSVFPVVAGISLCGVLCLFFLVKPPPAQLSTLADLAGITVASLVPKAAALPGIRLAVAVEGGEAGADAQAQPPASGCWRRAATSPTMVSLQATLKLLGQAPMPRLLPLCMMLGLPQALFYGTIPTHMTVSLAIKALLLGGAGVLGGSLLFGRLSDLIDRRLVVLLTMASLALATALAWVAIADGGRDPDLSDEENDLRDPATSLSDALFVVSYLIYGLGEGGLHTQTRASIAVCFPHDKETANAALMLVFSLAMGTGFVYGRVLDFEVQAGILYAVLAATLLGIAGLNLNPARPARYPRPVRRRQIKAIERGLKAGVAPSKLRRQAKQASGAAGVSSPSEAVAAHAYGPSHGPSSARLTEV